jgi:putative transposase
MFAVSQRRACQAICQPRATQRYERILKNDEPVLVKRMIELAKLRPKYKNHVWSYDFVHDRTYNEKAIRMLTIIDEHTRECLAIAVDRRLNSQNVMDVLSQLFIEHGTLQYIRSDNGPEFIAKRLRWWMKRHQINILFIEPGSPWENGHIEAFNGKIREEWLKREVFDTLFEQVLIERWRQEYNTVRPHSSLGYRPPAPETIQPK